MSPRLKTLRKVANPPIINGFKPYGGSANLSESKCVNLLFEEYEALRLSDYEGLGHHQASVLMGVSRPTFTRIYASALRKIAKAFVEGKQIIIEGGKVYFDSDWYHCQNCDCYFNNPEKDKVIEKCPLCGSNSFDKYEDERLPIDDHERAINDICICPNCGYEIEHQLGVPCSRHQCPKCSKFMIRKSKNKNL